MSPYIFLYLFVYIFHAVKSKIYILFVAYISSCIHLCLNVHAWCVKPYFYGSKVIET